MAIGNRTAMRIDVLCVVGQAQTAQYGQALCRKGFVEFNHIKISDLQAGLGQQFLNCGHRPDPHHTGEHACGGEAGDSGQGLQAMARYTYFAGQQKCRGTIIHSGCVAGGDAATFSKCRFEAGKTLQGGVRTGVLVFGDLQGCTPLAAWHGDRDDFFHQYATALCLCGALLAAQGKRILVGTADTVFFGHVFCGFAHGIDAI